MTDLATRIEQAGNGSLLLPVGMILIHYAAVYGQDGPVVIEQRINGRWKLLKD